LRSEPARAADPQRTARSSAEGPELQLGRLQIFQNRLQRSKYTLPASVRLSVRLLRFSRRIPSRFSTCITCLLTVAVDRSIRSAAATKVPDSTTCRNTRMLVNVSIGVVYAVSRGGPTEASICRSGSSTL
jgi:hypothetical protein